MARRALPWALLAAACTARPLPVPGDSIGIMQTAAGTGRASFDGDGRPARESSLYAPVAVGFGPGGRPEIIDWNNHRVRALQADGTLLTILGTGVEQPGPPNVLSIAFSIHHPFDVARGAGEEPIYAGFHDPRVFKVDRGDRVRIVAGLGTEGLAGDGGNAQLALLNEPSGVAVASNGDVYLADSKNHVIRRVDGQEVIHAFAGAGRRGYAGDGGPAAQALFSGPTRIRFDERGGLYVCDTENHAVRYIDPAGDVRTLAGRGARGAAGDGGPATEAELARPTDVLLLDNGAWLIADSGNHRVRRVDGMGTISTLIGTATAAFAGDGGPAEEASLASPTGLALDAEGGLWIADTDNHRVRLVRHTPLAPRTRTP